MAWQAGLITLIGTMTIFGITFWLIRSTRSPERAEAVTPGIYAMRGKYFIFLSLVILITLFATLRGLPYFPPEGAAPAYEVTVKGKLWFWEVTEIKALSGTTEIAPTAVPAGKLVQFSISSEDVNHGLAIYNSQGQLLIQTQAMPGYPSKLYYTFNEPGEYFLVCLEYCGMGHQSMTSKFTVL